MNNITAHIYRHDYLALMRMTSGKKSLNLLHIVAISTFQTCPGKQVGLSNDVTGVRTRTCKTYLGQDIP